MLTLDTYGCRSDTEACKECTNAYANEGQLLHMYQSKVENGDGSAHILRRDNQLILYIPSLIMHICLEY